MSAGGGQRSRQRSAAAGQRRPPLTRWTPERIRHELESLARELGHRPRYRDYYEHDRIALMSAMARNGGLRRWTSTLSVPEPPPTLRRVSPPRAGVKRGRPREWTDERIEHELRVYLADKDGFPTAAQMERDGRSGLRTAIRYRGVSYWAERLGVPLRNGQDRRPYGPEDAVRDAREVIAAHGHLPGPRVIRGLGYPRLATFVRYRTGNSGRFVAEYLSTPA